MFFRALSLLLGFTLMLAPVPVPASTNPFDSFGGKWQGAGELKFRGTKRPKCSSQNTPVKPNTLTVRFKCVTHADVFEAECQFTADGDSVTGRCSAFSQTTTLAGSISTDGFTAVGSTKRGLVLLTYRRVDANHLAVFVHMGKIVLSIKKMIASQ